MHLSHQKDFYWPQAAGSLNSSNKLGEFNLGGKGCRKPA